MEMAMSTKTLICETCGVEFEKRRNEYNRRVRLGKNKFYCGSKCSGKRPENISHIKEVSSDFPVWEKAPYSEDEFSKFRYTLKGIKQRCKHPKNGKLKECTTTLEDLKELWESQNEICPLTGWKLTLRTHSQRQTLTTRRASLDRIDSSKGYVKGNIRFISVIANFAKNAFTDKDLIEFCKAVSENNE
jgi:hypothetical protein